MTKYLKGLFAIHTVVAFILGAPLLLAPGRFLALFDWAPIDPLITRLLGAALIALAWSSFQGFRATDRSQVITIIVMEIIFTGLSTIGWLRHLTKGAWPLVVWLLFWLMVVFFLAWLIAYVQKRPS